MMPNPSGDTMFEIYLSRWSIDPNLSREDLIYEDQFVRLPEIDETINLRNSWTQEYLGMFRVVGFRDIMKNRNSRGATIFLEAESTAPQLPQAEIIETTPMLYEALREEPTPPYITDEVAGRAIETMGGTVANLLRQRFGPDSQSAAKVQTLPLSTITRMIQESGSPQNLDLNKLNILLQ